MKRFSLRESLLLCAPIPLIGLVWLVPRLLHPPKDPNAVIALSVQQKPSIFGFSRRNPSLQFAWEAKATGGPEYGYRIGFHERIVAVTKTGEKIVYSAPAVAGSVNVMVSSGGGVTPGQSAMMRRDLQIEGEHIPVTAKRLEWRGEVVAVPRKSGSIDAPASAAQLAKWAKIKGAARVQKVFPLQFDIERNAILMSETQPVNATNASRGVDTCVTVEVRDQAQRFSRRLVAFDGKTARVLWHDKSDGRNKLWQGEQGSYFGGSTRFDLLFKLREVPSSWGEIAFLYDVVFVDGKQGSSQSADLKTLAALEKAGGRRFSRRVVVRAKGQSIAAPAYQKTPNLKLTSIQTSKTPKGAQILVSMRYTGPRARPEIDVPGIVELFDLKGDSLDGIGQNVRVKAGQKPREWVLEINLSGARTKWKPRLACRMEVEIADEDAAPLRVKRNLVLP